MTSERKDHDRKRDAGAPVVPHYDRPSGHLRPRHHGVKEHNGAEGGDERAGVGAHSGEALFISEQATYRQKHTCVRCTKLSRKQG